MANQVSARGAAADASGATTDALGTARDALENHRWQEAYEGFAAADKTGPLSGDDLEAYALAAYFSAQPVVVMDARERAYKTHLAAGDKDRAATVALILGRELVYQGKTSISGA